MKFIAASSTEVGTTLLFYYGAKALRGLSGVLHGMSLARSGAAAVSLQSYLVFLWHLAKNTSLGNGTQGLP